MGERRCLYCGEILPAGCSPRRLYCCTACRRQYQNDRRRDERAEARELREAARGWMQPDPWSCHEEYQDLDEDEARWLVAGIDPLPVEYGNEADALSGPLASFLPQAVPGWRKKEMGWKKKWLCLC